MHPNRPPTIANISYDAVDVQRYEPFSQFDLLASVNLSSGVEYQLRNHLSLQVSPFVRLPTKKVGHESLAFDTFGMAVIVKYK